MSKLKIVIICLICLITLGCNNSSKKEELVNYVKDNKSVDIIERLDKSITEISMFPSQDSEEEFIYLVQGIKENINKFSVNEIYDISEKLKINYSFSFNKINYSLNDFKNDQDYILKEATKNLD